VDDVIVHRLGEDEYLLVINAGRARRISTGFAITFATTPARLTARSSISPTIYADCDSGAEGRDLLQKLTDANLSTVNSIG